MKVLACLQAQWPEFSSQGLHGRRREPTAASCPLTATPRCGGTHTHLYITRSKQKHKEIRTPELLLFSVLQPDFWIWKRCPPFNRYKRPLLHILWTRDTVDKQISVLSVCMEGEFLRLKIMAQFKMFCCFPSWERDAPPPPDSVYPVSEEAS